MTERPFMKLFVGDYAADTGHLNAAQHGAYLLLLMAYWSRGKLPSGERELARIARMTPRQWKANRPIISAFFDPQWRHKRIENELTEYYRRGSK